MPEEVSAEQFTRMQNILKTVPFAELLGLELVGASIGTATLRLTIRPELTQNYGVLHGGAMASLIDTATAFAVVAQLQSNDRFTTVDLTVNYLRPVTAGWLNCQATVVREGRRLITLSADVHDQDGKLAAMAVSTYIKLPALDQP